MTDKPKLEPDENDRVIEFRLRKKHDSQQDTQLWVCRTCGLVLKDTKLCTKCHGQRSS